MQDRSQDDNLTAAQRQLLHCYKRLAHMDMEKIKYFARKCSLKKKSHHTKLNAVHSACKRNNKEIKYLTQQLDDPSKKAISNQV